MKKPRLSEKPLLLLDRDGTLIEEGEYLSDPKQVRLLPGVPVALKRLKHAGFRIVVVSNQSGVGRGWITPGQLGRVNHRFLQLLKAKKAPIDGLYWCPHKPSARCPCRKPKLGMAKRAARDLGISWRHSISVGDRPSDVQIGQRAGGFGILVLTGYGACWKRDSRADYVAKNFKEAVSWILKKTSSRKE